MYTAKRLGFADKKIAELWNMDEKEVYDYRKQHGIIPVYKMVDTCAAEFESQTPYFYGTYEEENESIKSEKPSVIVLGSGPIRIGQGVEFDYATVHSVWAIQEAFQALQLKGIKSRFIYFPEENHWILKPQNSVIWHTEFYKWLKETL